MSLEEIISMLPYCPLGDVGMFKMLYCSWRKFRRMYDELGLPPMTPFTNLDLFKYDLLGVFQNYILRTAVLKYKYSNRSNEDYSIYEVSAEIKKVLKTGKKPKLKSLPIDPVPKKGGVARFIHMGIKTEDLSELIPTCIKYNSKNISTFIELLKKQYFPHDKTSEYEKLLTYVAAGNLEILKYYKNEEILGAIISSEINTELIFEGMIRFSEGQEHELDYHRSIYKDYVEELASFQKIYSKVDESRLGQLFYVAYDIIDNGRWFTPDVTLEMMVRACYRYCKYLMKKMYG
jgi:hypothetical protein